MGKHTEAASKNTTWPIIRNWHDGSVLIVDTIANAQQELNAEEVELETGAAPSRIRELRAGRATARAVMQRLGLEPHPLLADANGAPLWPSGLCGSIAHSAAHIAVIAARLQSLRSIGIDIDDGRDLGIAASDVVVSSESSDLVSSGLAGDLATATRLAFSVKEAIFKCQAPITGFQTLGFLDVVLRATSGGTILAVPSTNLPGDAVTAIAATKNIVTELQGVTVAISVLPPS